MKTLYNENFYNVKGIASNSALIFIFPFVGVGYFFMEGLISRGFFGVSLILYIFTIRYLRNNWDIFIALFRTFTLKKENFYGKDFLFDFLDNINGKFFNIAEKVQNSKTNINKVEDININLNSGEEKDKNMGNTNTDLKKEKIEGGKTEGLKKQSLKKENKKSGGFLQKIKDILNIA